MDEDMFEELKLHLRVDYIDDGVEQSIKDLQKTAEEFLTNSGVVKNYKSCLYKQAIKILVSYWFDNEKMEVKMKTTTRMISHSLEGIIFQLRGINGNI
ncbi:Phage gp6-like head-tail connector protein [[Clostridium] sordellii]|uniref:head-tail connector protein n=1 Tax=Bacillota TaxID=1239 RepID=UPI0005E6BE3A|nr:head-tail connector protein [Paeniclostridium sordellii]CEN25118.1 Phage gp6-like head-tail connector protein [[Clostridium] sordellii] [Paeniclostridium sordellii]